MLYIIFILHQTATRIENSIIQSLLYIIFILHQTATLGDLGLLTFGCISSSSYIKPQPIL